MASATAAPEAIHFAGPITGTLSHGRDWYVPSFAAPTPSVSSGQTHTTECYEWTNAIGGPLFEVHVYGAVAGASIELQMTNDGSSAVGSHVAKIYDSPLATGKIALIPDAALSRPTESYRIPDVANHTSYWTVAADKRSGTLDAWLWQTPYRQPTGGDVHVYGQWSC